MRPMRDIDRRCVDKAQLMAFRPSTHSGSVIANGATGKVEAVTSVFVL